MINKEDYIEYRKTLVRYGTIIEDNSLEKNGHHWRRTVISLNGRKYIVQMEDGEVLDIIEN